MEGEKKKEREKGGGSVHIIWIRLLKDVINVITFPCLC